MKFTLDSLWKPLEGRQRSRSNMRTRRLSVEHLENRQLMAVLLDPTFSGDGKLTTSFGSSSENAQAVAIQSDGRIVVAGRTFDGSTDDIAIARYDSNGSLDTTFGNGTGKVTTFFPTIRFCHRPPSPPRVCGVTDSTEEEAKAVAVQPDGKILVAGSVGTSNADFLLLRLSSNGDIDTTFGASGFVRTSFGGSRDIATTIAIQSDNKILVAGYTYNGLNYDFAVVRYLPTGAVDTGFGVDGQFKRDITGESDYAFGLILRPDGRILVGGYSSLDTEVLQLILLTPSGAIDPSFGTNGTVSRPVAPLTEDDDFSPSGYILTEDQTAYLLGSDLVGDNRVFSIIKINSNGEIDTRFNDGVRLRTPVGLDAEAYAGVFQADGRLLLVGSSNQGSAFHSNHEFAVVRYGIAPTITSYNVPATGMEGASISLSATAIDGSASQPTQKYKWRITGPGLSVNLLGKNVSFIAPDNGTYIVTLFAKDELGVTTTRVSTIVVANIAPVITTFTIPTSTRGNRNLRFLGAATDAAKNKDPLSYTWLVTGPGQYRQTLVGKQPVWRSPTAVGNYTIRLIVTDGDGGKVVRIGRLAVT